MGRIRGFTLIELMIATLILCVVIYLAVSSVMTSQRTYTSGTLLALIEQRGRFLIDRAKEELTGARILGVTNSHTRIDFQVPVDWDGDNDVLSDSGSVEYGAIGDFGPEYGWSYAYEFTATQTLDEGTDGFDYNNDGLFDATFLVGKLYRVVKDENGVEQLRVAIDDDIVLRRGGTGEMDYGIMTGLAGDDPLFKQTDASGNEVAFSPVLVHVNVWHGKMDYDRKTFYLRNNVYIIKLRNPQ
jgi:prepilin-type N-terminal cleavage/methylation domain-containing protein